MRILPYIVREVSDLQVSKMRSNGTDRKRGRVMTNEEAKVFLDNLKICIEEHPIIADWLIEIADRKTEPQRGCDADCNEDCIECAKETELWKAEQTDCSWK